MRIFITSIFITLTILSFGQDVIDLNHFSNVKGNVSSIAETHYTAKMGFGGVETDEVMFRIHSTLNEKNNIQKIIVEYKWGEAYSYKYNDDGKLVELAWEFDNSQEPRYINKYYYKNALLTKAEHYKQHSLESYSGLTLDSNSDLIDGKYIVVSRVNFKYDELGNKIEEQHFGISHYLYCNPYKQYYTSLRSVTDWFYTVYQGNCNLRSYMPDGNDQKQEYRDNVKVGQYDDGKIKEEDYYLGNKKILYDYDDQGNWIKCTYYAYDKPYKIVEREIAYR